MKKSWWIITLIIVLIIIISLGGYFYYTNLQNNKSVCGNGICEPGEELTVTCARPPMTLCSETGTCPEDCFNNISTREEAIAFAENDSNVIKFLNENNNSIIINAELNHNNQWNVFVSKGIGLPSIYEIEFYSNGTIIEKYNIENGKYDYYLK